MVPTPRDMRALRQLRDWQQQPPRVTRQLALGWRGYLLLIGAASGTLLASQYAGIPWAGALICGVALGAMLRDLRWIRGLVRGWPLTATIVDWRRVDRLLDPAAGPDDAMPTQQDPTP